MDQPIKRREINASTLFLKEKFFKNVKTIDITDNKKLSCCDLAMDITNEADDTIPYARCETFDLTIKKS